MVGVHSEGARCNPGGCPSEVANREDVSLQKTWMLFKERQDMRIKVLLSVLQVLLDNHKSASSLHRHTCQQHGRASSRCGTQLLLMYSRTNAPEDQECSQPCAPHQGTHSHHSALQKFQLVWCPEHGQILSCGQLTQVAPPAAMAETPMPHTASAQDCRSGDTSWGQVYSGQLVPG